MPDNQFINRTAYTDKLSFEFTDNATIDSFYYNYNDDHTWDKV